MTRVDHIDNPHAPLPNAVVPSATAFIRDDAGAVLLIRRGDNGDWALPGGAHDLGEHIAATAVRETREESGIDIEVTGVVGLYTDPGHLVEYGDGEVRQQFSICFRGRVTGGSPTTSLESVEVRFVPESELDSLSINPSMRLRIAHGFGGADQPYIG